MELLTILLGIFAIAIAFNLALFVVKLAANVAFTALSGAVSGALGCGILGVIAAVIVSLVGVESVALGSIAAPCAAVGAILGAVLVFVPERFLESSPSKSNYEFETPVSTYGYENLPELEAPAGYVYVIEDKDRPGIYKIGQTTNPKRRKQQITSNTGSKLEFVKLIRSNNAQRTEKRLHQRYGDSRIAGEWFKLMDSEARSIR